MPVRAKVRCYKVTQNKREDQTVYSETVCFGAVCSEDPNSENKWFADATPALELSQTINNPAAFGSFVANQEYYLDFTPVPAPAAAPADAPADAPAA